MTPTNKILAALLVAQAVLLAVTWSSDIGRAGDVETTTLFGDATAADVTAITIQSRGKDAVPKRPGEPERAAVPPKIVQLARRGDAWVVPGADDFPAEASKVDEVIGKLVGATHREPVATSAASHNALSVGEATYDKKVTVTVDGETRTLYVGGAKGQSVHARFDGDDTVYLARGVSAWGLADSIDTYIDTAYVDVAEPTRIEATNAQGTITLDKDDTGAWRVAELRPDANVDDSRIRSYVGAARVLRIVEPVGKTSKPEYGLDDPEATVTLSAGDETVRYVVGAEDGDARYVKADGRDYIVRVRKFGLDSVLSQTPEKFIHEPMGADAMPPGGIPGLPPGVGMPAPGSQPMMPPPGH